MWLYSASVVLVWDSFLPSTLLWPYSSKVHLVLATALYILYILRSIYISATYIYIYYSSEFLIATSRKKNLCVCRVSCVRLIILVSRGSSKHYCCRTLRQVGYRKVRVAWMLFPNSCRCSVGGETIRLSSQSSRVRYSAPLFFSFFFFFPFFFRFVFSMGGGVLCMYVPFLFFQHTTHL